MHAQRIQALQTPTFCIKVRDVTRDVVYERVLRQRSQGEALGRLTADLAHELNNNLTVLLGQMDLIAARAPLSMRHELERANQAAVRSAEGLRPLLAFGHATPFGASVLDIQNVTREHCRDFTQRRRPHAQIHVDCEAKQGAGIVGDRALFELMLEHILTNAHEASHGRGDIKVSLRSADADTTRWMLSIEDDGPGMQPDVRQRAFDSDFSTKGASPDRASTKRGLGLTICQTVVRHLRGSIRFDASYISGTRVLVELPKAEQDEGPAPRRADAVIPRMRASACVLVADDKAEIREIARRSLEHAGHRVICASDGVETIEKLQEHGDGIDVLLLDCRMPRMDGNAVLQRMAERELDIPIILSTGYSTDESDAAQKANYLLPKPWKPSELLELIDRCVQARAARLRDVASDVRARPQARSPSVEPA